DLSVSKTVNGGASVDVISYPTTVNYHLKVCNTATIPTEVLTLNDSLLGAGCTSNLGAPPFSLAVGQCVEADCPLTLTSFESCSLLASTPRGVPVSPQALVNTLTATFEGGPRADSTLVQCFPEPESPPPPPFQCDNTLYIITGNPSVLNIFDPDS